MICINVAVFISVVSIGSWIMLISRIFPPVLLVELKFCSQNGLVFVEFQLKCHIRLGYLLQKLFKRLQNLIIFLLKFSISIFWRFNISKYVYLIEMTWKIMWFRDKKETNKFENSIGQFMLHIFFLQEICKRKWNYANSRTSNPIKFDEEEILCNQFPMSHPQ